MPAHEFGDRDADRSARRGWSLGTEIEWGSIDVARSALDAELLPLSRRAALRAARRTVCLSALLSLLSHDAHASALISSQLYDSWKHFHALRSYLDAIEFLPTITDSELERELNDAADKPTRAGDVPTLLLKLVDDAARDGALFALVSSQANETSLARIASRIAADRQSHALAYSSLLARPASPNSASARIA